MKISKRQLLYAVVLFPFLLWSYSASGLTKYIYPNSMIRIFTILIPSMFFVIKNMNLYDVPRMSAHSVIIVLTFIVMCVNNQNFARGMFSVEVGYILVMVTCMVLSRKNEWIDLFFKMLILGSAFYMIMTFVSYFSRDIYVNIINPLFVERGSYNDLLVNYNKGYIAGFTNHTSGNAIFLTLGAGTLACKLLVNSTNLKRKKSQIIIVVLFFIALLLTGKRSHVLFSIFSLFVVFWIYTSDKPKSRIVKMIGVMIVAVTMFSIMLQFIPSISNAFDKFALTADEGDISKGRISQALLAIELFKTSPIFGIGWDGFKYWYSDSAGIFLNVHNVFAQLLCETGIIGFTIFISLIVINTIRTIAALKLFSRNKQDTKGCVHVCMAAFLQLFFVLYCFTGNPLYDAQIFFPYAFSMAVIEFYYRSTLRRTL